jgi:hypothetical protein
MTLRPNINECKTLAETKAWIREAEILAASFPRPQKSWLSTLDPAAYGNNDTRRRYYEHFLRLHGKTIKPGVTSGVT